MQGRHKSKYSGLESRSLSSSTLIKKCNTTVNELWQCCFENYIELKMKNAILTRFIFLLSNEK